MFDLSERWHVAQMGCRNIERTTLFAGLSSDLIINHFENQNRIATGRRHSDEVKKVVTYGYVREVQSIFKWEKL